MTPILVRHFLFGFSDGPTPFLSAVYAGTIDKWNQDALPTADTNQFARLDVSGTRIDRVFLRASPPRMRVVMHQCIREQALRIV